MEKPNIFIKNIVNNALQTKQCLVYISTWKQLSFHKQKGGEMLEIQEN